MRMKLGNLKPQIIDATKRWTGTLCWRNYRWLQSANWIFDNSSHKSLLKSTSRIGISLVLTQLNTSSGPRAARATTRITYRCTGGSDGLKVISVYQSSMISDEGEDERDTGFRQVLNIIVTPVSFVCVSNSAQRNTAWVRESCTPCMPQATCRPHVSRLFIYIWHTVTRLARSFYLFWLRNL